MSEDITNLYTLDELKQQIAQEHLSFKKSGPMFNLLATSNSNKVHLLLENVRFMDRLHSSEARVKVWFEIPEFHPVASCFLGNGWFPSWIINQLHQRHQFNGRLATTLDMLIRTGRYKLTTKTFYCNEHDSFDNVALFHETESPDVPRFHNHQDEQNESCIVSDDWITNENLDIVLEVAGVFVPANNNEVAYLITLLKQVLIKDSPSPVYQANSLPLPPLPRLDVFESGDSSIQRILYVIGNRIDVLDTIQHWRIAKIVATRTDNVFVHFESYSDHWDEWIPMSSNRLAALHTHTHNIQIMSDSDDSDNDTKAPTTKEIEEQRKLLETFAQRKREREKAKEDTFEQFKKQVCAGSNEITHEQLIVELGKQGFEKKMVQKMPEKVLAPLKSMVERQLNWQARLENETAKLAQDKEKQEDEVMKSKCKICFANDACILFMPCNHVTCCKVCSDKLSECPFCRKAIRSKLHCFLM
jgi:hypothetical protein